MAEERKLAHEKFLDFIRQPAKDGLAAVAEAEAVIIVIPWAMGLNYPPGTIITRNGGLNVQELIMCKRQLLRMFEHIDSLVLKAIGQAISDKEAIRKPAQDKEDS